MRLRSARRDEIREWALARWKVEAPPPLVISDEQELTQRVLTRREVQAGQRALFKALYSADQAGLSYSDLAKAMGRTPSELAGVLGALGHRVQGTEGVPSGKVLGVSLFLEITQGREEWRYWLKPAFRELLEGDELAHLNLLG